MYVRKRFTRIISLVLCLIMVLLTSVLAQPTTDDYSNHWAGKQIKSFLEKGFVSVHKDGSFKPNEPITRADFVAIANKAFGLTEKDKTSFKDVKPGDTYYNDFLIARKAGYITGNPNGTALPKGYMTRQEYAVILTRLLKLDNKKDINVADKFADSADIPTWSKGSIGVVAKSGYMKGEPGNKFNPKGHITRGQAVVVLERGYLDNVKVAYNIPGTYSEKLIDGNVAINVPNVKLENTTITGRLIIGEGVGNGNVILKNVVVKGDTIVKGGGLNSIIIEDSQIKNIILIKEDNKVRVVVVGSTTVDRVDMQSGGRLEEQGTAGNGFGYITIAESVDPNEPIILRGNFETVQVQADGVNLNVESGSIARLDVAQTASNAQISLGTGTSVASMVVNAAAAVTGTGTVGTAQVNVQGTTITAPTTTMNTAAGVTVSTTIPTSPTPTPAPTPIPTPSTGGGSGGGGDDSDSTPAVTSVTVTPETASVAQGGTQQLTPTVVVVGGAAQTLNWTTSDVSGKVTVNGSGLVSVAIDATPGAYTITATSTVDASKSDTATITVTLPVSVMGGTVAITGTAKFNQTLTANIAGLTYTPATAADVPTYQWKRGGSNIVGATASTYTLALEDIGQTITVTVTADGVNATGSVTSAATATVAKADGPGAPTSGVTYSVAAGTVTGLGTTYEYSINGGGWTTTATGVVFTAGAVTVRTKATASALPSAAETIGTIAAAAAPTLVYDDALNTITGLGATYEYKIDAGAWTSGDIAGDFTGTKTVLVRLKATASALASQEQTINFTTP